LGSLAEVFNLLGCDATSWVVGSQHFEKMQSVLLKHVDPCRLDHYAVSKLWQPNNSDIWHHIPEAHEKQMKEQAKKMNVASLRSADQAKTSAECKLAKASKYMKKLAISVDKF
jgi:hypothetical protein